MRGLLVALLCITLLLCGCVLYLWLQGQRSMTETAPPPIVTLPPTGDSGNEILDSYSLRYNGKLYKYRDNLMCILLMGLDNTVDGTQEDEGERSDVNVLAVFDPDAGLINLVSISRDAICTYPVYDENGQHLYDTSGQLTLSFLAGGGGHGGCTNCRDAVSGIFRGLQINGYAALYLDGLPPITDAVGGVTLKVLETLRYGTYYYWQEGQELDLNGDMASHYVAAREHTVDGNNLRMQRQKQFMLALFSKAKAQVKEDPSQVLNVYSAAKDYIITDLSLSEMSYLAFSAAGMHLNTDMYNVPGETVLEDGFAKYYIDDDALFEMILEVFYTEVETNN